MMSRYILIYRIMLVNSFPHQNKQKNVREGNSYFPRTFLKQVGHFFINFGCTQTECPNQRFEYSVSCDKKEVSL